MKWGTFVRRLVAVIRTALRSPDSRVRDTANRIADVLERAIQLTPPERRDQ